MPDSNEDASPSPTSVSVASAIERWLTLRGEKRFAAADAAYGDIVGHTRASDFDLVHGYAVNEAIAMRSANALALMDLALGIDPHSAAAHCHRGNVLRDLGRPEDALASYEQALANDPAYGIALANRGVVLHDMERYAEAIESCDNAIAASAGNAAVHYNRGNALHALGRYSEALEDYDRALSLNPRHAKALNNRGNTLHALQRFDEARASYEQSIALEPDPAEALNNLGNLQRETGDLEAAMESHRRFLSSNPDIAFAHHALIFTLLHARAEWREITAQCRTFDERFGRLADRRPYANSRDPDRRLRIGYVSSDLREHPVAFHLEPVLANHDLRAVDVYCYANHGEDDAVTARLMRHGAHWRRVTALSDDALASAIRADGIDVLVDLGGHTTQSRLAAFAHKPAPVQVTWLGLPATTGLSTIDYRLTDDRVDPVGMTESEHSETLVRLSCHACYAPPAELPPVNELPAHKRGYVTFGSFNKIEKITPFTYSLWSKVLAAVPDSRLLMICPPVIARLVEARFTALGIDPDRLSFVRHVPLADYLRWHHTVDIMLDTFPFNGGTVTRNALWMGVPVLTLAGRVPVSRVGLALMSEVGLGELVAATEAGYVAAASSWAREPDRLAEIRQALRPRMEAARFSDGAGYTRELETAYRQMWRRWCVG